MKARNSFLSLSALTLLTFCLLALVSTSAMAQGLSVQSRVSHPYLPANKHSDIAATIRVDGGEAFGDDKRAPLNLSLVIDRSTSMSGGKLEQAKAASDKLIEMLSPTDRLSIVSYGSDVTVESESLLATDTNKQVLRGVVKQVALRGGTNLSGGYSKGLELTERHLSQDSINRVIVLSDGIANEGIVSVPALGRLAQNGLAKGVTLTTLGIGLNFNEVLMTRMAREGAGNYYFVEDEKALASIFLKEWNGLASAVAKNAKVTIELAPGVELKKLHGFSYKAKRNTVTVPLAAFFAHQRKDILLELAVSTAATGDKKVADVVVRWTDPLDQKRKSRSATLASHVTTDASLLKKVDSKVLARVEQLRVSETLDEAMAEFDKGNRKQAVKLIQEQRASMNKNKVRYDFEDDSFDRVEAELQTMEKTMERNSSNSTEGKRLKKRARKRSYDVSQSLELF